MAPLMRGFFWAERTRPCRSWLASEDDLAADHFQSGVHIHFCGNDSWRFRSYSESLFQTPKRNQKALPLHSVPRQGSACPHSGIAPGARRHRPSMAGGGYRGIHAAVPPTQRLRSASGKGATDQDQKPKQQQLQDQQLREQARSHSWTGYIPERWVGCQTAFAGKPAPTVDRRTAFASHHSSGRALARLQLLILTHRPLERPSGGSAQWATRHGWPMAAGPRSRTGARACRAWARHRTKGARALGYLGLFQVTRCKSETASRRYRRNGYAPQQFSPQKQPLIPKRYKNTYDTIFYV